jgi:hypothetical protein
MLVSDGRDADWTLETTALPAARTARDDASELLGSHTRKAHKLSPRDGALHLRLAEAPATILRPTEGRAGLVLMTADRPVDRRRKNKL